MGKDTLFWNDDYTKDAYQQAYTELDAFFEILCHYCNNDLININKLKISQTQKEQILTCIKNNNLTYREGQNRYSLDIMDAITNNEIFLIQAGVGIGKSIGYLLPIFYTYKNVKNFNKILISTSSIALQEQLLRTIKLIY